jgi:hypothetical protein
MSAGGSTHGSSSTPHSIARPHRLSSIEYGLSLVVGTGMPRSASAYVHLLLARLEFPLTDRREDFDIGIERCDADLEPHLVVALAGTAVRDVAARLACASSTRCFDDDRAAHRRLTSGYLFSYSALAFSALPRNSSTYSSRTSLTIDSTAPMSSAFCARTRGPAAPGLRLSPARSRRCRGSPGST